MPSPPAPDDEIAPHLTLRADDLPGAGWMPHLIELTDEEQIAASGQPSFDHFPEHAVTASATSPRFVRGDAVAWSIAWLLDGAAAATDAFLRLADERFAHEFLGSELPFEGDGTSAMVLARDPSPPIPVGGLEHAVRHRARLTAGDANGLVVVHLDLLALLAGRATSLVILGQSPDPHPVPDIDRLARRVSDRLTLVG